MSWECLSEESGEDSHGFSSIMYNHDIREPIECSDSRDTKFYGSQDDSDIFFLFSFLLEDCFPRFQQ